MKQHLERRRRALSTRIRGDIWRGGGEELFQLESEVMDLKLDMEESVPVVPSPVTVDQMLGVTLVAEKVWVKIQQ